MNRHLLSLLAAITVAGCQAGHPQTGTIEFTVDGEAHRIGDVVLTVRANPRVFDGDLVKTIDRGGEHIFGYFLERPVRTETPDTLVDVQWFLRTADHGSGLTGTVRTQGAGGDAISLTVLINEAGLSLTNERRGDHTAWVAVDAVEGGRARGRFGGRLQVARADPETGVAVELVEVEDGRFDVPYREMFEFRDN
jgi:hypothetical protein